jgi:hypothetical protein
MKCVGFWTAAKDTITLIMSNVARISLVSGFGAFFEGLGSVCVGLSTTLIAYLVLTKTEYYQNIVISPITPTLVVLLISFCIGVFIMSLLGTSADAILVLFCIDEDSNAGGAKNHPPVYYNYM